MNTTNNNTYNFPVRQTAVNGLAIVGFVALIVVGISLAIYSTRFVPGVVSRVGGAAVYLGSVFNPTPAPALTVVPTQTASSTIFFGTSSSTVSTSTTTTTTNVITTQVSPSKIIPTTLGPTSGSYPPVRGTPTTNVAVTPYGLSDLTVSVDAVGYLMSGSDTSTFFIGSPVPSGKLPAVMVTVSNLGTNWTGTWSMNASFPSTANTFNSLDSIAPGGSNSYILSADRANTGIGQPVTITVDSDNTVTEIHENNNTASVNLNVL